MNSSMMRRGASAVGVCLFGVIVATAGVALADGDAPAAPSPLPGTTSRADEIVIEASASERLPRASSIAGTTSGPTARHDGIAPVAPPIVVSTKALDSSGGDGVNASLAGPGSFCSGFEPPCFIGYIGGGGSGQPQNCDWHASGSALPSYTWPRILDVDPLTGLQHLRFQYDPAQATGDPDLVADDGSRNWAFSDDIVPTPAEGVVNLSLDIRIAGTIPTDNAYIIQPQAPTQELLTTVFVFNPGGTISVVAVSLKKNDTNFTITPTTATWLPGVWYHVDICVDVPNDRIRYFLDGILIYSTGDGEGGVGGPLGCGVFAGSIIEHALIRYEANANDGSVVDVDNVCIEPDACPEPTGACCTNDGGVLGCEENLTIDACAALGGTFSGSGTDCSVCPMFIECLESTESCYEAHGSGGCQTASCCELVCAFDSFCCDSWDSACVEIALELCGPPPLCDQPGANCQALSTVNASTSQVGAFQVAENFTPAFGGEINSICWSGAYLPDVVTDDFTVRYYDCVDGAPGPMIAEYTQAGGTLMVTGKQGTGLEVAGTAPIYDYTATHADLTVSPGTVYFIEIINAPASGTWFWEWATGGDGISYQKPDGIDYARYFRQPTDVAFCLNLELGDTEGLCDVPAAQPCDLNLSSATLEENEACGQMPDRNAGCSTAQPGPHMFRNFTPSTDPAAPTIIHGESYADGNARDVDWYRFTVPSGVDVNGDGQVFLCLAIASEIPMQAVLVTEDPADGECGDVTIATLEAVGIDCASSLAVSYPIANLSEQYILVRSADGLELFDGFPCANDYLLEAALVDNSAQCFPAPSCPQDLDGDDVVGFGDLLDVLSFWGPCADPPNCPQDLDGDGIVGFGDLLEILSFWGPCA